MRRLCVFCGSSSGGSRVLYADSAAGSAQAWPGAAWGWCYGGGISA